MLLFHFTNLTTVIFIANIIVAICILFLERNDPSVTLAWILVIFMLPIAGIVLYILLAQNITRRRMYKLSPTDKDELARQAHMQLNNFDNTSPYYSDQLKKMIRMNLVYSEAIFTEDNKVDVYTDVQEMFTQMLDDIQNAKESINVMFFIVKNDFMGRMLVDALTAKARQGVEVRFLMDAQGSLSMRRKILKDYLKAGGKLEYFFPPRLVPISLKFNYRNHRKIVVIDGKTGYTGGTNIGNEYLGMSKKFGYWRDTQLRIQGSGVEDLNARFILDWKFASKEDIPLESVYYSFASCGEGKSGVQIISSGPDTTREETKRVFMKMISIAEKRLYIQTPYFVPDKAIMEALTMAVHSGVDVRIMIPCMPDHIFVYWATYSYVGELLKEGVKAYVYDDGFMHSKLMVADGTVSSVGSTNFDRRSFTLNFETNAVVYDSDVAKKIEDAFETDMSKCHELTQELYNTRSLWIKFKECMARLVSDLL